MGKRSHKPTAAVASVTAPPEVAAASRLAVGLAVLLALVPAIGWPGEGVRADSLKSLTLLLGTLVLAILWLWRAASVLWHPALWLPLGMSAACLLSLAWAHDSFLALFEAGRWLLIGLLALLALNALRAAASLRWLCGGALLGAALTAFTGTAQHFLDVDWFAQFAAPAATFVNKNFAAEFVVTAWPLGCWLWLQARTPRARWLLAAGLGLCLFYLLITGTRAAWVAWLLSTAALALMWWRSRERPALHRPSLALLLTLPLLLALLPGTNGSGLSRTTARLASTQSELAQGGGSLAVRRDLWGTALRMAAAQPMLGVGAGNYEVQAQAFQPPQWQRSPLHPVDFRAHNDYLEWLAELGVLAAAGLLAAAGWLLWQPARALWSVAAPLDDARAAALAAALALATAASFGFPLRLAGGTLLFALLLALAQHAQARDIAWPPRARMAAASCAALLLLLAAWGGWRALTADLRLESGWKLAAAHTQSGVAQQRARPRVAALLREASDLSPWSRHVLVLAADGLMKAGANAQARQLLARVTQRRPHFVAGWLMQARLAGLEQELAAAETLCTRALDLAPQSAEARVQCTQLTEQARGGAAAWAAAQEHWRGVQSLGRIALPGAEDFFLQYTRLGLAQGAAAEVVAALATAPALGVDAPRLAVLRARILAAELNDADAALTVLSEIRARTPATQWPALIRDVDPALLSQLPATLP
jgi:O-antigen ligase